MPINWSTFLANVVTLSNEAPNPEDFARALTELTAGVTFSTAGAGAGAGAPPACQEGSSNESRSTPNRSTDEERTANAAAAPQERVVAERDLMECADALRSLSQTEREDAPDDPPRISSRLFQPPEKELHDHVASVRFPNGGVCFEVNDPTYQPSWCMNRYAHKKKRRYLYCLGIYKCPVQSCQFKSNPVLPRESCKKGTPPSKARGSGICIVHNRELEHQPCEATMIIGPVNKDDENSPLKVDHSGIHEHAKPHETKASKAALERLKEIVKDNAEAKPSHIARGSNTRAAARELHPALNNLDRLEYEIKKIREANRVVELKDLPNLEDIQGVKFVKCASLDPGSAAIIFQFPNMAKIARDNTLYAFQTDTIEGWIDEEDYPTMSVTVTSTHCPVIGRHVPVLISITFGRTGLHYKAHFTELLKSLRYKDASDLIERFPGNIPLFKSYPLDAFRANFPGNISDFSAAMKLGFKLAVKELLNISEDEEIELDELYRCCEVHFKRTVARVSQSHSLVPVQDKQKFNGLVYGKLLNKKATKEEYDSAIVSLKKEFPHLRRWIDWYLEDDRAPSIFPAAMNGTISGHGTDDNAQEGCGRWIQDGCGPEGYRPKLGHCISHLFRTGLGVHYDYLEEVHGNPTRYGSKSDPIEREEKRQQSPKRKKKGKYSNDGRGPDTETELLPKRSSQKIDRSRKSPLANDLVDLRKFMPWKYTVGERLVTNTCPLDSVLQLLNLLRRYNIVSPEVFQLDPILNEVMNLMDSEDYNDARELWIQHVMTWIAPRDVSLSPTKWDLNSDSIHYTAACVLFQFSYKKVYDACSAKADDCPHVSVYSDTEGSVPTQEIISSFIDITINKEQYSDLQVYFDDEFNHYGHRRKLRNEDNEHSIRCGMDVELTGILPGCNGLRFVLRNIVVDPHLLELRLRYTIPKLKIIRPDQIALSLTIHGHEYQWVGAILYSSGYHYRSMALVGGKFLVYDGLWKRMQWHRQDKPFGGNWHAAKLWYHRQDKRIDDMVCKKIDDVWSPYGFSVGPCRESAEASDITNLCVVCDGLIKTTTPCLTKKETYADPCGLHIGIRALYHFPRCCAQFRGGESDEVLKALEDSVYTGRYEEQLKAEFERVTHIDTVDMVNSYDDKQTEVLTISEIRSLVEAGDNGDDESSAGTMSSNQKNVRFSVGYKFKKEFLGENGQAEWVDGEVSEVDGDRRMVAYSDASKLNELLHCDDLEELPERPRYKYSLRVGDVVKYTVALLDGSHKIETVEATVLKIKWEGIFNDSWQVMTSSAHPLMPDNSFHVVGSCHKDAPPREMEHDMGSLEINMISGNISPAWNHRTLESQLLETVPNGETEAAFLVSTSRAAKRARKQMDDGASNESIESGSSDAVPDVGQISQAPAMKGGYNLRKRDRKN